MSLDVEKFCTPEANRFRERQAKASAHLNPTDYELELSCFRNAAFGHGFPGAGLKYQFELNCFRYQWPDSMLLEVDDYDNFWAKRIIRGLCRWKFLNLVGCASCVAGHTRILDPTTGLKPTIQEIYERNESPTVMTLYGPKKAGVPFIKGFSELFEVTLENGRVFTCTEEHRILTPRGYRMLSELSVGALVCTFSESHQASSWDASLSAHASDVASSPRKAEGFQENYSAYFHPGGGPPQKDQDTFQSFSPLLGDALRHKTCASGSEGDLSSLHTGNHPYRSLRHPSIGGTSDPSELLEKDGRFRSFVKIPVCDYPLLPWLLRSRPDSSLVSPSERQDPDDTHSDLFCNLASSDRIHHSYRGTLSYSRVSAIRRAQRGVFFDLIVPDAHHYFAEGAIHHNSGKTFIAAAHVYTAWKSSPWNTSGYLSTTTAEAGEARTWGAIKDLFQKDSSPKTGVLLEYRHMIVSQEDPNDKSRDYRDAIAAVTVPVGQEGQKVVGTISGRKNDNVIWVCDEMAFMDAGILMARLNLLANPFTQFIGISNKPREGDPMHYDAEPKGAKYPFGWRSVNPDVDDAWTTQAGCCYYFDGERSPNMRAPANKPPFPKLMTEEMRQAIETVSGGRDSAGYWSQVRGFPQAAEVQDTVLNGVLISSKKADQDPIWGIEHPTCIGGLDLGFREDGDPTVLGFGYIGRIVNGDMILSFEKHTIPIRTSMTSKLAYEEQVAERVIEECKKRNCHEIELDISGDGGISAQAIAKKSQETGYKLQLHLCSFMGSPDDGVFFEIGGKRVEAKVLFDRKVSQLWYSFRVSVQNEVIRGLNPTSDAVKQLCQRRVWQDDRKRYIVEKKKEMKKRIKRSPDDGDSFCLCHNLAIRKGLKGSGRTAPRPPKPQEFPKAKPQQYQYGHRQASMYGKR